MDVCVCVCVATINRRGDMAPLTRHIHHGIPIQFLRFVVLSYRDKCMFHFVDTNVQLYDQFDLKLQQQKNRNNSMFSYFYAIFFIRFPSWSRQVWSNSWIIFIEFFVLYWLE